MISKKEKLFRRLNRNRIGAILLWIFLITVAIPMFAAIFTSFFFRYVVEARLLNEYKALSYMARIYEESADKKEALSILDKDGRDYFIKDKDGKIVYENGENTCSDEFNEVSLFSYDDSEKITLYSDKEKRFIYPSHTGDVSVDLPFIFEWINENGAMHGIEAGRESFDMPVWIAIDLEGSDETLFGKMFFSMDMADFAFIGVFVAVMGVLTVVVFILIIVYIIANSVRRKKFRKLFFMDDITGGHNWMWFLINGEKMLRRGSNKRNRYAVLDVVLVNYRNFCMCHSVAEGEDLLCQVEHTIERNLSKDEMCAHYASANFAVLLKVTNEELLKSRVTEFIKRLEKIDDVHRFSFRIGVDIIDVSVDANGKPVRRKNIDLEKEYNNACAARVTLEGTDESGAAYFNDELVAEQKWVDMVQEKQKSAILNEEFKVYYQPKYDPNTNKLSGAEALIRWDSPDYGFKGPGQFIPIFEKNGFITEIDHYMLKHVARDQKKWLDEGLKCVPVSVNVSRAHFIESDLAEQIRDIVDNEGTPHDLIEIELTESAFFDDKNALINTINKLKSYGFVVSMDDFGSGYSSLNSLKDMPLDVLKLDAEFFRGENRGKRGEIVVSEAIKLAKSLNMRTVAEGVEEKEQVDFLAGQGCDMIQGYFFAKPMPAADYEERMKKGEA